MYCWDLNTPLQVIMSRRISDINKNKMVRSFVQEILLYHFFISKSFLTKKLFRGEGMSTSYPRAYGGIKNPTSTHFFPMFPFVSPPLKILKKQRFSDFFRVNGSVSFCFPTTFFKKKRL